jgi:hypothetical protein
MPEWGTRLAIVPASPSSSKSKTIPFFLCGLRGIVCALCGKGFELGIKFTILNRKVRKERKEIQLEVKL